MRNAGTPPRRAPAPAPRVPALQEIAGLARAASLQFPRRGLEVVLLPHRHHRPSATQGDSGSWTPGVADFDVGIHAPSGNGRPRCGVPVSGFVPRGPALSSAPPSPRPRPHFHPAPAWPRPWPVRYGCLPAQAPPRPASAPLRAQRGFSADRSLGGAA